MKIPRNNCRPFAVAGTVLIVLFVSSCELFSPQFASQFADMALQEIRVANVSFTLAWDYTETMIPESPAALGGFRIYYRPQGQLEWKLMTEMTDVSAVPGANEYSFVVTTAFIPYGSYQFGVSSLTRSGRESPLHLSSDSSARPAGGWFVTWTPP